MIRLPSVIAVLTPSIIDGLLASTVTPGRTPPVVSTTVPPICCALAMPGASSRQASTASAVRVPRFRPNRPEISLDELERVIGNDVSLTHRFLKYLASAAFSWRASISSVRQGLVLLGKAPTQRWVSLIALSEMGREKPQEVLVNAAVRAKCCEMLAGDVGFPARGSELFLLGALSLIDAMLDQPMEKVLEQLPISADLKLALTGQTSELRPVLDYVTSYEQGDWTTCSVLASKLGVQDDKASALYRDAIAWANEVLGS